MPEQQLLPKKTKRTRIKMRKGKTQRKTEKADQDRKIERSDVPALWHSGHEIPAVRRLVV